MDDIKLAMLGNKEAAQRLTDAGVMVPCCCGDDAHIKYDENRGYKVCCGSLTCGNETLWWGDKGTAIRVWNTRAPIMSSGEMEILDAKD